jgi:hypothetical protein
MSDQKNVPGVTIYGQIAIDHIVDVNQLIRLGPVSDLLRIGEDGELIFNKGAYISTEESYIPWFFGPLDIYDGGKKYSATEVCRFGGRIIAIIQKGLVRELGVPNKELGGGGPNNVKLLYQVFRKFPIQFIGTYRIRGSEERGTDIWEYALQSMVSKLDLIPLHENPPINICFEGVGTDRDDRTIIRSPFPPLPLDRLRDIRWPRADGSTIIVNTIYTRTLAVEALIAATTQAKLSIIALTQALCSKSPFLDDERKFFQESYPNIDFSHINSVHDLILKYVLPNSGAILILNEGELEHLSGVSVFDKRHRKRLLGGVLDGLNRLRELQGDHIEKVFFTMGKQGSLCCLDREGDLHYCGVTDVPGATAGKTAIGDLYAGTIIGYEHVKRIIQRKSINVGYQLTAAAAAADVGVAKGFRAVNVLSIDSGIIESWRNYIGLGPINSVIKKAEKLYGSLYEVRLEDVEWDKISISGEKQAGPTFLEIDLTRDYLRPPFANSVHLETK